MRKILAIILLSFMAGCSSVKERSIWYNWYNIQYDAATYIPFYYYTYLRFPNVKELSDYCWNIVNSAYGYRFASYAEYQAEYQQNENKRNIYENNIGGVEDFFQFLMKNQKELSFKMRKGKMAFYWKSKIVLTFDFDLCELQNERERVWDFFHLFDATETRTIIDIDPSDDFCRMRENVKNTWLADHKQEIQVFDHFVLLRYNRTRGYTLYCPPDSITTENSYLKKLGVALDTFLVNRNVETIQFVTAVPRLREEDSE